MPEFRTATVTALLEGRDGLQRVSTDLGRAYVLTELTGSVAVGDRVVLNTTAVSLGLGTGGWHVVHWNLARDEWIERGPGHIMKLRYTSLQLDAGAAEEHHPDLSPTLEGMPVVVCGVHSQLPCVAVAARAVLPEARIVYVMTDGAALPIALSDLVAALREVQLITTTITAGHAFGGDLEAVSVPGALAVARHVDRADLAIVAMGPGVVGTGSSLGTSSIEVAGILDSVAALGGRPVLAVRMSSGDQRPRHRGLSHHARTALDLVRSPVFVPVPAAGLVHDDRHLVRVIEQPSVAGLLYAVGLHVTTMGRSPEADPLFFEAAGAAGHLAASLVVPQ